MNSAKEESKDGVETVIQYTASAARWLEGIMMGNNVVRVGQARLGNGGQGQHRKISIG